MHNANVDLRIHILFVLISRSVGGAELHTVSLANGLDKNKFRVSVAHLKDEYDGTDVLDSLSSEIMVFCANVSKKVDIAALRRLCNFSKTESVDIIVCTNTFSLFYGWLVSRLAKIRAPLAEIFHTTSLATRKMKMQMLFYRPFFRAADLVVFVCESQRDYWKSRRLRVSLSSVIHNGIDVNRFKNDFTVNEVLSVRARFGFSPSDFVVGICAALRPEKAHSDLLQALVLLRSRGLSVKCMIIGEGPERERILRTIDALALHDDVVLTGYTSDVRAYISACDVMALVSHYIETFSLSALEAMALSKPMIMSKVGGAAEQVIHGYNGFLFAAGDISALADCILEVRKVNTNGLMGFNARTLVVERFSIEKMIGMFEAVFLSLVGARNQLRRCARVSEQSGP